MKVGFARVDITPTTAVPMSGYGASTCRRMERALDQLYATCVAITDENDETAILIGNDMLLTYTSVTLAAKSIIAKAAGVPGDRVMIASSHTHSGPDLIEEKDPAIIEYEAYLMPQLCKVAKQAMEDRKPAKMFVSEIEVEGMNYVRHYKAEDIITGEISYLGDNFGEGPTKRIVDHASKADPTMHLVKFVREGGKDVVIANWRAHATMVGSMDRSLLSADYVGQFRNVLEENTGLHVLYLQGAAGNINPSSRIPGETYTRDHELFGARLAHYAQEGLKEMRPLADGAVRTNRTMFRARVNHTLDHLADVAREIGRRFEQTGNGKEAIAQGRPYGIRSPYQALAIADRSVAPSHFEMQLNVIAIGEGLAIVTAPNELFDTNSMYLEANAPYEKVLTMGYCNGNWYYLPSDFAWGHTCYESDISPFARGTAEEVMEHYLKVLRGWKEN